MREKWYDRASRLCILNNPPFLKTKIDGDDSRIRIWYLDGVRKLASNGRKLGYSDRIMEGTFGCIWFIYFFHFGGRRYPDLLLFVILDSITIKKHVKSHALLFYISSTSEIFTPFPALIHSTLLLSSCGNRCHPPPSPL